MLSETEAILYSFLNIFFFVFHFVLIIFNLFGWIFKKLRKWHLVSVVLTAFSWFALGAFYGWGYCFLTDWHYAIRDQLNLESDADSYIHFLLQKLNLDFWSSDTTDILTGVLFAVVFVLSIVLNIRDYKIKRSKR